VTETNRRAAIAVADRATGPDDLRLLLTMLGLVEPAPAAKKRLHGRPPVDHGHGHYRTYMKGCRCDACRKANSDKWAADLAARKQEPFRADLAGHGKCSTYKNYGCRCDACRAANRDACAARRARRRRESALAETGGAK
jgi:hypothetical protein